MKRWDTMFARWAATPRNVEHLCFELLVEDLRADVLAEVKRRPAHPLGPISVAVADSHANYFTRDMVVILVDVYVLDLLTPDPFPSFILLPRLHRLGNLYRKARNAWPSRP